MAGMAGNVGCSDSLAGGASGRPGRGIIRVAGSGVGGERGSTRLRHPYLASSPGPPCLDGFARPVITRVLLLEVSEHAFGTIDGPEHQCLVVAIIEPFRVLALHYCWLPSPCGHSSICVPSSTTRSGGMSKYATAEMAFRDIAAKRALRHRDMPGLVVVISVSRPR